MNTLIIFVKRRNFQCKPCDCHRPQRSCGNVFTGICHSVHGGGGGVCSRHPCGQTSTPQADTPWQTHTSRQTRSPAQCMQGYTTPHPVHAGIYAPPAATAVDGTHPTGMHSCVTYFQTLNKVLLPCFSIYMGFDIEKRLVVAFTFYECSFIILHNGYNVNETL